VTPERFFFEDIRGQVLCIDEVHCVSETSHSFRAAYLKLRDLKLNHSLILGLTATASQTTVDHISSIMQFESVVRSRKILRRNIHVTVSEEDDLFRGVSRLLRTENFKEGSVLIFSAFLSTCESLCDWLKG
jgi:ATP-dependent DNA helicase Q4